jgi:hypothetical protein
VASEKLIVRWNLPRLAADLAAHLESLRDAMVMDATFDCAEFLEPYNLSADDYRMVVGLAFHEDCVDCGRLFDHYMVRKDIWAQAGLRPTDNCCRECLALRLNRPLRPDDFTSCWLNHDQGLAPRPDYPRLEMRCFRDQGARGELCLKCRKPIDTESHCSQRWGGFYCADCCPVCQPTEANIRFAEMFYSAAIRGPAAG